MSAIHQMETEAVPVIFEDNEITAKRIALSKQQRMEDLRVAMSRGKQWETLRSVQEPRHTVWAVVPVVFEDNEITAKRIAISKRQQREEFFVAMSRGKQIEALRSMQEPRHTVWAVVPVLTWIVVLAIYGYITVYAMTHINEVIMAVALIQGSHH